VERRRALGWACLIAVTLIWATPRLWAKALTEYYDSYTQNFFRYLFGAAAVWIGLPLYRRRRMPAGWDGWRRQILPALLNSGMQIFAIQALYYIGAGLNMLLGRVSLLVSAALSYWLFAEERPLLGSRRFRVGVLVLLIGTAGLAVGVGESRSSGYFTGVALTLAASLCWGGYAVAAKRSMAGFDPMSAFAAISLISFAILSVPAIALGDLGQVFRAGWGPFWAMAGSGALCIGVGHVLYLASLHVLGPGLVISMTAISPALTAMLSNVIFGEPFPPLKLAAAVLTMAGTAIVVAPRRRASPPPVEEG